MPAALTHLFTQRMRQLRRSTSGAVAVRFDRIETHNQPAMRDYTAAAATLTLAGQRRAAALTAAYLQRALGSPIELDPDQHIGIAVRGGVTLEEVYGRAFAPVFASDDIAEGRRRIVTAAQTSVQLAMRSAATAAMTDQPKVVGYRRVLNGVSCGFCAAASTRRYKRAELLPLHQRCDCTVAPIVGDDDPGAVINQELLDRLRDASDRPDYWRSRHFDVTDDGQIRLPEIAEVDHGELGPVLVHADHELTPA